MSSSAALDFTYLYPFTSSVEKTDQGAGLRLATCDANQDHPHFFEGRLLYPRLIGDMLTVLSDIVRTNYFMPTPSLLDPVVTSNEEMLRFEGFSGCCGVYARVDLPEKSFEGDLMRRGTTNVDFNNPMRAALVRLRDHDDARLSVGADEVALSRNDSAVVEKKVKLPIRWIKGFSEVQAYQPLMKMKVEVPAHEGRRFIRSLPRGGGGKRPSFIKQWGKKIRLTHQEKSGAIRVLGTERIRAIEPLLNTAEKLRIWYDEEAGTSGWEIVSDAGKLFLMISPEVYRGFSGEGQVLKKLAIGDWKKALPQVQAGLSWQSRVSVTDLEKQTAFDRESIEAALAVLGSRGLAGYDVTSGKYFHRILPFELDKVEQLQPRLKGANKLLESGNVEILKSMEKNEFDLGVGGTDVTHYVRLRADQDKCTCPWFSKYQGQRGPCKHILAARMFAERKNAE